MADPAETLRLGLYQFSPTFGQPAANAARIAAAARRSGADLLLTPELSLTGYGIGDAAHAFARPVVPGSSLGLAELDAAGPLILGLPERDDALVFNTAALLDGGRCRFRHRKIYLPTYGTFDESRFFARGREVDVFSIGEWRIGLLVCEDLWHPGLTYLLAARGIHLLLVQAAAPGRGAWEGSEEGGRFASSDVWARIVRTFAQMYGIYVALANRIGVEGGLTFAGGSQLAGPDGSIVARLDDRTEEVLLADLSLDDVRAARRPYAHSRDEDLRLVAAELARILDADA